jgi:hypothetical protein
MKIFFKDDDLSAQQQKFIKLISNHTRKFHGLETLTELFFQLFGWKNQKEYESKHSYYGQHSIDFNNIHQHGFYFFNELNELQKKVMFTTQRRKLALYFTESKEQDDIAVQVLIGLHAPEISMFDKFLNILSLKSQLNGNEHIPYYQLQNLEKRRHMSLSCANEHEQAQFIVENSLNDAMVVGGFFYVTEKVYDLILPFIKQLSKSHNKTVVVTKLLNETINDISFNCIAGVKKGSMNLYSAIQENALIIVIKSQNSNLFDDPLLIERFGSYHYHYSFNEQLELGTSLYKNENSLAHFTYPFVASIDSSNPDFEICGSFLRSARAMGIGCVVFHQEHVTPPKYLFNRDYSCSDQRKYGRQQDYK